MRSPKQLVKEMWDNWDVSRTAWFGPSFSALRSMFSESFFQRPVMSGTTVNYNLARSLYRNDNPRYNLGAGFVRPIIDRTVEYMGLPNVTSENADVDAFLNECITDYWGEKFQEMFRDSIRDSKVVVRFRQPRLDNPLFTEDDRLHGKLELIPPEQIDIIFDPTDPDLVERCAITHWIEVDERTDEEIVRGAMPRRREHEIIEIITQDAYTFFDKSSRITLDTWTTPNTWHFVPVWPCWNEYATDLGGGQSDIEGVFPFIEAFHDVLEQALSAHKYHSTPKATFNIKDMASFLKNNFPDVVDEVGRIIPGKTISWSGRQIFFMNVDEKAGFVEARSVLGDSKTLLEFLIDCIAIASETPKWALLATDSVIPETDATVQPFAKKIVRKRVQFAPIVVVMCKMALAAQGKVPETVRVSWPPVRLSDLVNKAQAIQQIILGMDVAASHEWLADETVIKILSTLFSEVNAPQIERALAKDNVVPAVPATAPASDTQALPPSKSNGNGGGSKSTATKAVSKALATTKASKS